MKKLSFYDGHFYPKTEPEIKEYINAFNKTTCKTDIKDIRVIIVPHAGYIYSGHTANIAYNLASKQKYKRIVVMGPSHKIAFNGASIASFKSYQTPLGELSIDENFTQILKEQFSFTGFNQKCHQEHSTETQMPFIAHYFKDVQVIEIVYGKIDPKELSKLVDFVLNEDKTLLVISTDLSHFHSLEKANKLDSICIEAIKNQNIAQLSSGCEACGIVGITAFLHVSFKHNFKIDIKEYTTSFEKTKDSSSVVGYMSAVCGYD